MGWNEKNLKAVSIQAIGNGLWLGTLVWLVLGLWLDVAGFVPCWIGATIFSWIVAIWRGARTIVRAEMDEELSLLSGKGANTSDSVMSSHIENVERRIDAIIATNNIAEKYNIVLDVASIDELPYGHYRDLRSAMCSGQAIVRMAPFGHGMSSNLSIFATPFQKFISTLMSVLMWLLPVVGVGMAFFDGNWWWLILLGSPFVVFPLAKSIYMNALFSAIGVSEKAFCFAYCGRTITVETPDGTIDSRNWEPMGREANSAEQMVKEAAIAIEQDHEWLANHPRLEKLFDEVADWTDDQFVVATEVVDDFLHGEEGEESSPEITAIFTQIRGWPQHQRRATFNLIEAVIDFDFDDELTECADELAPTQYQLVIDCIQTLARVERPLGHPLAEELRDEVQKWPEEQMEIAFEAVKAFTQNERDVFEKLSKRLTSAQFKFLQEHLLRLIEFEKKRV